MKLTLILFLIGFQQISSKIVIDITTDSEQSPSINYSGLEIEVVTEDDIKLFFTNPTMKEAVKLHYGRKPTGVYYSKPTPWGDLYSRFNWEPVKKIVSVKNARVKNIDKKPVVILKQDFENTSNNTVKVNTGISHTVENSITTSWSTNKEFTLTQEIEYDINVIFAKISGNTGISYTSAWGQSEEKSESVTIGATSAVETELKPGQSVTAELSVTSGYVEIEVIYKMYLRGNLAINMKQKLDGHHFWGPQVQDVMKSANIDNEKIVVETIKFGFYIDAKLKVSDKDTGLPL